MRWRSSRALPPARSPEAQRGPSIRAPGTPGRARTVDDARFAISLRSRWADERPVPDSEIPTCDTGNCRSRAAGTAGEERSTGAETTRPPEVEACPAENGTKTPRPRLAPPSRRASSIHAANPCFPGAHYRIPGMRSRAGVKVNLSSRRARFRSGRIAAPQRPSDDDRHPPPNAPAPSAMRALRVSRIRGRSGGPFPSNRRDPTPRTTRLRELHR